MPLLFYFHVLGFSSLHMEQGTGESLSCRSTLKEITNTKQTLVQTQLIDFLTYNQDDRSKIPYKGIIDTESNLSSKVLRNILITLGLPFDGFWEGKSLAIDALLLHYRNKIAHGERYYLGEEIYRDLHGLVIAALDYTKTTFENAAIQKEYRREI